MHIPTHTNMCNCILTYYPTPPHPQHTHTHVYTSPTPTLSSRFTKLKCTGNSRAYEHLCVEIFIKHIEMQMQASFTASDLVEALIITQANFQKIEERKKKEKNVGGGGCKHRFFVFFLFSCRKFLHISFLLEIFFRNQYNYLATPVDTRWPVLRYMM